MADDHVRRAGLVEWLAMTVDCPEPSAIAEFYVALLGGSIIHRAADGVSTEAGGRLINFWADPDYRPPTWPSREVPMHAHFEYVVEDPDAAASNSWLWAPGWRCTRIRTTRTWW